jgi:thiaminase
MLDRRGRFIEYILERPDVQQVWKNHTEHRFVAGLADGTLPMKSFKYYLIQDYLFLVINTLLQFFSNYEATDSLGSICKGQRISGV